MLTPAQCRAARALLDWTQSQLSAATSISAVSIRAFERGGVMREANKVTIVHAFLEAGVEFIPENGGGAGVRLKHRTTPRDEGLHASKLTSENDG